MDCCVSGEPFGGRHNLITANAIVSAKREHNNLEGAATNVTSVAHPRDLRKLEND